MTPPSSIFNMFGQSPIHPLQAHMSKAYACTKALLPFFEAVFASNWEVAEIEQGKIAALEDDADVIKRELRLNLPKGLFLPVHRGDLLELISSQDKIANKAEDIAGFILGRRMKFPSDIRTLYQDFLQRSIDAVKQANKAIHELDELLETGFSGNEAKLVCEMIETLDIIENDTDEMQVKIRYALFKLEKDLPPIDVIFLYKVIEWTGDLADRANTVGSRLSLLLAR